MGPAAVRQAIRIKKSEWFEAKSSPRGWIVGPVLCLWMSAFDRHGPMVVGYIREEGFGSRIVGRAGADLNGMVMSLLLTLLMFWLTWKMYQHGQGTTGAYVVIAILFGLGLPLTLWINSKDREQADPLVRFISKSVGERSASTNSVFRPALDATPIEGTVMIIDSEVIAKSPSQSAVRETILDLAPDSFLIIEFGPETYMQTLRKYDRYVLEKRDGGSDQHFRANTELEADAVVDAMTAYLHGKQPVPLTNWKRVTV